MEKIVFLAWILVISTSTILQAQSKYYSKSHPYKPTPEKKTHLRFYFHDTLTGKKPTAVQIAGPKSATDPLPFGSTFAVDDPLTEGPEITSKVIGNARGIYVVTNQQDKNLTLVLYANLGFTSGKFKGSTLSVFSRNAVDENVREMTVVGGTGRFRMARGFLLETTHYANVNGDSVLLYNVEVVHH